MAKAEDLKLHRSTITISSVHILVQTCSELISIELGGTNDDDAAAVVAIAQHCSKLEKLTINYTRITATSLLALSERGLPLQELDISHIPTINTANMAARCSHALSRIRHLRTLSIYATYKTNLAIPYMTGLTNIVVYDKDMEVLPLCRTNPLLQELTCYDRCGITDTTLIELIHACPHLHTLDVPYETDITDIGILTLSEHCPQLQLFSLKRCHKVTEVAVLQLLQRCHKLTRLEVSSSSLSEETWTQLDRNTQKRVSLWHLID